MHRRCLSCSAPHGPIPPPFFGPKGFASALAGASALCSPLPFASSSPEVLHYPTVPTRSFFTPKVYRTPYASLCTPSDLLHLRCYMCTTTISLHDTTFIFFFTMHLRCSLHQRCIRALHHSFLHRRCTTAGASPFHNALPPFHSFCAYAKVVLPTPSLNADSIRCKERRMGPKKIRSDAKKRTENGTFARSTTNKTFHFSAMSCLSLLRYVLLPMHLRSSPHHPLRSFLRLIRALHLLFYIEDVQPLVHCTGPILRYARRRKSESRTYRKRDEQSEAGGTEKTCGAWNGQLIRCTYRSTFRRCT